MRMITRFIKDDNGADLVEYALIVGLVSLAAVTVLPGVGSAIGGLFTELITAINEVEF